MPGSALGQPTRVHRNRINCLVVFVCVACLLTFLGAVQDDAVQSSVQLRRLHQTAARRDINRLAALAGQRGVDPGVPEVVRASAGTGLLNSVGLGYALTGLFGGTTKSTFDFQTASNSRTANASADYKSTAIAPPGPGRATVRSGGDVLVLAQRNNTAVNISTPATPAPRPVRQTGVEVLFAAARDYSNAGDPAGVTLRDRVDPIPGFPKDKPNRRSIYGSDYDYGTPSLPDSADSQSSLEAWLDAAQERAAAAGRTGATVTAPALIARSHATSTSIKGVLSAEDRTGDDFVNVVTSNTVATPPVPIEQSGADAAVQATAKSYKLSFRPSMAHTKATADSNVDAKQLWQGTGAKSSTLSYVAGIKEVKTKSSNAAMSGCFGTSYGRLG